jgi:cobalt-zinc-cadmium efflux system protein
MSADSHNHSHHGHRPVARSESRRLMMVTILTAIYMLAEGFGGWWTGSLALFADAGHMLADVAR